MIHLKLIDLDKDYEDLDDKILLNDLKVESGEETKKMLFDAVGEEFNMSASCLCGHLKNNYRKGQKCPKCGTRVITQHSKIKPLLWIRKLTDEAKFLSPEVYILMNKFLGNRKIDAMEWLCDPSSKSLGVSNNLLNIANMIGGRGYFNVINNLPLILKVVRKTTNKIKLEELTILENLILSKNTFSDYLPLASKKLFLVEENSSGSYSYSVLADVIDLAVYVIHITKTPMTVKSVEVSTTKIIKKSADLFLKYSNDLLARKGGLVRKNIYGSRLFFTFRGVITTLPHTEEYNTIHVPWQVGLTSFRPHLINKLVKDGYTVKQASNILFRYSNEYNSKIDSYLKELLKESGGKIYVSGNRNPSLGLNSFQLLGISKFKTDANDRTISISALLAKFFNHDYDGDEMNFSLLLDNFITKKMMNLAPHKNVSTAGIGEISTGLNLPATSGAITANYLHKVCIEEEEQEDSVYDELMSS